LNTEVTVKPLNKIDLSAISDILQKTCVVIKTYSDKSEQEFLEIGSRLQTYISAIHELSEVSSRLLTSFSGENLQKGTSELNLLLKKFSEYFSETATEVNSDKEELQSISHLVESIIEGSDWFKKIVKHLTMLSIATKIESSRLGESDNGFLLLAENVDRLSGEIKSKSDSILKKAFHLIEETDATTKSLELLEGKQRERANVILNNISFSLNTFENKLTDCFLKTERITGSSDSLSRNIYDIVTSVQFHDITRQQLEHVVEAISELAGNLQNRQADITVTVDDYGMVHDICELQVRQLNNTANEFNIAVTDIFTNLQSVAGNMTAISTESNDLFADNSYGHESSLKSVQNELHEISEGVKSNIAFENQLEESIKHVVNIVDDLSLFVQEIEDIGAEIELLALNALVKAAHTEVNGSALSVLAQEIQNLSIGTKLQTNLYSDILNNITTTSKRLRVNISGSDNSNKTNDLFAANNEITQLIDSMIYTEIESGKMVSKINSDIKLLKEEIESVASNTMIHNKAEVFFHDVSTSLNSIVADLKENTDLIPNKSQNTAELMNKYSMQIERKIHQDYSVSNHKPKLNPTSDKITPDTEQFGDNIELF
jgi:methyl-accepting chemotaxis protein